MGTPAMTRSRDRKRRSSSGDGGLVTPGIVVEVRGPPGIKRGGACSGHRLDRIPPGDARLVSAPLYGRCLLVEANLARAAVVPDRRTGSNLRLTGDICQAVWISEPESRLPHLYEMHVTEDSRRGRRPRTARRGAAPSRSEARRA